MNKEQEEYLKKTLSAYGENQDTNKKRILIISEINSIPFLERKFKDHQLYSVVNDCIENISKIGIKHYIKHVTQAINSGEIHFDGITGFFNTPNAISVALSHLTNKPGTSLESMVRCQSKYECRVLQQQSVPEHTPEFMMDSVYFSAENDVTNAFVKPIRASRSFASSEVHNADQFKAIIDESEEQLRIQNEPFVELIEATTNDESLIAIAKTSNQYICEGVIKGDQLAANGYVVNGKITLHGIVKEVFLPNSISFERHEFPSDLPQTWLDRIHSMIERFIAHTGLNHTEFDIEFRIDFDNDKLEIIELNPHVVSQYENMYTLAGGDDMLTTLCALACGNTPPEKISPPYKYCYSCELRTYEDCKVLAVPTEDHIGKVQAKYDHVKIVNRIPPDVEKLSDFHHPHDTFRYCIVSIPGQSKEEIFTKLDEIKDQLGYEFAPIEKESA